MINTGAVRILSRATDLLLKATFAPPCAVCAAPLESPLGGCVCPGCWSQVEPAAPSRWSSPVVATAGAGGDYNGPLQQIVHAFKYQGRRSLAAPLAALVATRHPSILDGADALVPVPLHAWRRMYRGFNQADDLARAIADRVYFSEDSRKSRPGLIAGLLWRSRWTAMQPGLGAQERRRNVGAAFALAPWLRAATRDQLLTDRTLVLIDDVRTTGATLDACATVLLQAGAREVRALTAAARELR